MNTCLFQLCIGVYGGWFGSSKKTIQYNIYHPIAFSNGAYAYVPTTISAPAKKGHWNKNNHKIVNIFPHLPAISYVAPVVTHHQTVITEPHPHQKIYDTLFEEPTPADPLQPIPVDPLQSEHVPFYQPKSYYAETSPYPHASHYQTNPSQDPVLSASPYETSQYASSSSYTNQQPQGANTSITVQNSRSFPEPTNSSQQQPSSTTTTASTQYIPPRGSPSTGVALPTGVPPPTGIPPPTGAPGQTAMPSTT